MSEQTAAKERPILFSAPMIRAILENRKTQTRRIVKHPRSTGAFVRVDYGNGWWPYVSVDGESFSDASGNETPMLPPHGGIGDRLWVRETWRPYGWWPNNLTLQYRADNRIEDREVPDTVEGDHWLDRICEQCSEECNKAGCNEDDGNWAWDGDENNPIQWRPSIHMPRWASRITLEVTDVRVEQLQLISDADIQAEGFESREEFAMFFKANVWNANPFVWCYSFKRVTA